MFNLSFSHLVLLLALGLIFIGPKQLPEVARMVGRLINDLKRASEEAFSSFTEARDSVTKVAEQTKTEIQEAVKPGTHSYNPRYDPLLHLPKDEAPAPAKQEDVEKNHSRSSSAGGGAETEPEEKASGVKTETAEGAVKRETENKRDS